MTLMPALTGGALISLSADPKQLLTRGPDGPLQCGADLYSYYSVPKAK